MTASDSPIPTPEQCRVYMEQFLPERLPTSTVARVAALTVTMRFAVRECGAWSFAFVEGKLQQVRADDGRPFDISFEVEPQTFLAVVGGQLSPQHAFFQNKITIQGQQERALVMGSLLEQFIRENPYHVEQPS